MRRLLVSVALASLAQGGAAKEECPPPKDHGVELARLVQELRDAPSRSAAILITNRMWTLWADAPDAQAQEMLDRGMKLREGFDYEGAIAALDALVAYCPDYAEGYNQRAFVNFLKKNHAAALPDLDRALALSPTHLGALTGRAMVLMALGREDEAQLDLKEALGLNPWLPERRLIRPDGPKPGETDL